MPEDPQQPEQPEGGPPTDEAPEGASGEPPEATPPEDGEDLAPEANEGAGADELGPGEAGAAPGPEIEGAEELAQAARPEAAEGEGPAAEGEGPAAEAEGEGQEGEGPEAEGEGPQAEGEPQREGEEPQREGEEPAAAAEGEAGAPRAERPRPGRRRSEDERPADEVIPGAHLEPDLVLEEQRSQEEGEFGEYGEYTDVEAEGAVAEGEAAEEAPAEPEPVARQPLDLAADARYQATGKRKSAVARVILKPGEGTYRINERHLDEYFPRVRLQRLARQPLEAAGYHTRMDVVARIHGGGVSAQAMALRHGVARALVEADPALRGELKRRGYLTRDPRVKERKKAGLKKARKRPQFSKR
jgi:small subunit ribosomal protein S9